MNARNIGIVGIGWLLSTGVFWSAHVYEFSLVLTLFLSILPWALAGAAMSLANRTRPAVELDLSKIALQGGLRPQHFSGGDSIIRQGDVAEHFYIITSGRVRVLIDDEYGSRTEVAELVAGQFFGEVGLIEDSVRTATVEAVEELDVLVMDKSSFADLMTHSGVASEHIRSVADQRKRGSDGTRQANNS